MVPNSFNPSRQQKSIHVNFLKGNRAKCTIHLIMNTFMRQYI
ncbi:hypothetical protein M153_5000012486 [Pseudoloma neurophilia]|uniref:Uncharacterized protein n=1 Tax=Pseudoloma neurophilia TaxID=146866 RepID=A0A0R0M7K5_9MICR|nr:hypothetical protein M153_5000012486 [Pseudoloma neurophilia]